MKPFYTLTEIKAAATKLAEAARTMDCAAPRTDAEGATESGQGVPYGTHGAAFVQVNPETLEIRCGACAGELDATALKKTAVVNARSGRTHYVSI